MKYLSKSSKIVMVLSMMAILLNPVLLVLGVNLELPVLVIVASLAVVAQAGYIWQLNANINDILTELNEQETVVITSHKANFIKNEQVDTLVMCKNRTHTYCRDCEHAVPHKHNSECDLHDCERTNS